MHAVLQEKYGPLMSVDEVAELLRVTRQTMYVNLQKPDFEIKFAKLGKKYLFATNDVADYITSNTRGVNNVTSIRQEK
tara:strand:+ start:285 stop:518 length:234 start_codon:yes stop_codon:yes gene_type:complete